jgi:DNA-binding winged helix-turn-helix (wHTH) protein
MDHEKTMKTRFEQFTVDSDTRQLLCGGTEIHLSTKAFDLLCVLLARRPSVVGKEELLRQIWPDSYVVEANLNVVVGEVRRAIADNVQSPRFIRTVHGVGYAFCGSATDIQNAATAAERADRARCWLVTNKRNYDLFEGDNIIGRDPSCDIWLDDPDVSRRHARIRIDSANRSAALDDLGSTNGTLLGRSRVKAQRLLSHGDVIRVGPFELKFRDGADEPQETRRVRRSGRRLDR